jgi:DNA-binding CsgD family transcriptional regulator
VLELVRQRLSNKEIARILDVRESTVKYHLSNILAKFRVGNRRALEMAKPETPRIWEQLSKTRS